MAWALNIRAPAALRGVLLTLAGRANDQGLVEREMAKLCYELLIEDPSTMRRILAHMAELGLLTRRSRPGPGAKQVIQLRVDIEPRALSAAVEADPYVYGNTRGTARDNAGEPARIGPKLVRETSATNPGEVALVRETSATIPGEVALDKLARTPTPVNELVNGSSLTPGGGGASALARTHEDDLPPPKLIKLTPSQISDLVLVYRGKDPDGEDGVRRRLGHFQNYEVTARWRGDPVEAASAWLQRDYDKLPRRRPIEPAAAAAPEVPPRKSEFERFNHGYRNY